jgi:hypothetical protein
MDENEYIESWIDTSITLNDWLQHRNINHWEIINQFDLEEEVINEIEQHQAELFNKCVNNSVQSQIDEIYKRPEAVKIEIIKEHLRVINLFTNSVNENPFIIELLKPIIIIRPKDYLCVLKSWQDQISNQFNDFRKDYNLSPTGLFSNSCYFSASVLYNYKKRIEEILNPKTPQPINNETDTEKYTAKHYLLAYLFECNAKGESFPIGNKKELERIGNERMGAGKGNRFYKVFNEVINKDLNAEKNLLEIGGEYWRKAVIELSKAPELVEKHLQSKQL